MQYQHIIGRKYRIIGEIGHGGTSMVYLVENIILKNYWVVKKLSRSSTMFSYEFAEIDFLKDLNHPMLPRIVDVIEDREFYYIVMDYIPGRNLLDYVTQEGPIAQRMAIRWTKELLDVLSYLHGRNPPIIYRDMKPSNIILDETNRLMLIDFGAARLYKENTEDTVYIGTHGYAAPEQYGRGVSNEKTDLFSLGMTLVHLVTGTHPYKLKDPINNELKRAGLSKKFIRFIEDLIQQDPEARPDNCNDAMMRLERINGPIVVFSKNREMAKEYRGIISVCSVLRNCGATSLSIMLGNYFAKKGLGTAIAELNPSGDFERLRKVSEQAEAIKYQDETMFMLGKLRFYPSVSDIGSIPRKGIDVLILDIGYPGGENSAQKITSADIKLVLCPDAVWKYEYIDQFMKDFEGMAKDEWIYVFPTSQKEMKWYQRRQFNTDLTVYLDLPLNPFKLSKEDEKHIDKTMNRVYSLSGQR